MKNSKVQTVNSFCKTAQDKCRHEGELPALFNIYQSYYNSTACSSYDYWAQTADLNDNDTLHSRIALKLYSLTVT